MNKESLFYKLFKRISLIKAYEVSKKETWEDDAYLVAGVECGWIKVDNKTWRKYLKAKERLSK